MKNIKTELKQIDWQFYITREVNFVTEHFMHEGWLKFTKRIFGKPILKRINFYREGVADIYVAKDDLKLFLTYIDQKWEKKELETVYNECISICREVENWLPTLSQISYKDLSDQDLLKLYEQVRQKAQQIAAPLIIPRLVDKVLTNKPDWEKNKKIIKFLKDFSCLNEYRRILTSKKLYRQWIPLFKEIGIRKNLSIQEMLFLLPQEIYGLFKKNININTIKKLTKKRYVGCLYLMVDEEIITVENNLTDYEKIFKITNNNVNNNEKIMGRCACKGVVQAKVKIIMKDSDYIEIKKGNILVSSMTQPEISKYVNKISGIVTNDGGILCHAAIIARENNVPCLTGTVIATQILQDGDEIYLNATKGFFQKRTKNNIDIEQIKFNSIVYDTNTQAIKKQDLAINLYNASNSKGLIIWLPGMSDQPFADNENPLLTYFVQKALVKNYAVAVIAFPGTAGNGHIEERTMSSMRQNIKDVLEELSENISDFQSIKKIIVGRSTGGTLAGSLIDLNVDNIVIIAGRLKTNELYKLIIKNKDSYPSISIKNNNLFGFSNLKPFIQAKYTVKTKFGDTLYCQNEQYVKELQIEEKKIQEGFFRTSQQSRKPRILAIQATDDQVVPYQLREWEKLARKSSVPIQLFSIPYACGHSFTTQPAIAQTTEQILQFIKS
ncbi:hypothetical protein COV87_01735 [Candidatus Roizmanbacteria bacterium CG11_big_fil_rev_8_21_14_0_20_37_16]|uniref:PEP-utilising enzyme mobile domain-containing protein n=1 Tax=Candidatus Roizmanbacteria bacterium CG11_big_fil_rev_8_21_14_0_20_37_16 TaxID=1974857 RepID=A0A2H0KKF9_9BACT|nr:MAG: hypothetical protein COV87_01735 [Candidatus Roizmanbacteria bacterium CG11_big_fil_rev_8_21_14_0_20_37_16]